MDEQVLRANLTEHTNSSVVTVCGHLLSGRHVRLLLCWPLCYPLWQV